jgi:hypothetical protein
MSQSLALMKYVERPTIRLHDSGDVTLLIGYGDDRKRVLVSTTVLRLASPVWKAMFGARWAESEASEIDLSHDDADAMLLVLRIAHLQFHDLAKGLKYRALLDLAVVCDKYDLIHLVRPFLDLYGWAKPYTYTLRQPIRHTARPIQYPGWLFIAWTFGYIESFCALAKQMSCTVEVHKVPGSVVIVVPGHGTVLERDMPPGILGTSIPQPLILPGRRLLNPEFHTAKLVFGSFTYC